MRGKGSFWFFVLAPVVAIVIAFFLFRPDASCNNYPDGRPRQLLFGMVAWPDALLDKSGTSCDPWDKITPGRPIGNILVAYTYETGAEPTHIAFLVQPDGSGFRMLVTGVESVSAPSSVVEAHRERGPATSHLVFFRDKTIYSRVREILAPMRDYSESVSGASQSNRYAVMCEKPSQSQAPAYTISWPGSDDGQPPARSEFRSRDCPVSAAARERIIRAYTMVSRLKQADEASGR